MPSYRRFFHRDGGVIITSPGIYLRYYTAVPYTYVEPYVEERVEVYEEPVAVLPADHGAALSAWAWILVRSDRPAEAMEEFVRVARTYPAAGVPRIGEAAALAMLGHLDRAVWVMRRAVRIDPEAVRYVPTDEGLRERFQRLVDRYRRREAHGISAPDAAFMLSALHALRGETEAAYAMIDLAIEVGDTSDGAAVLKAFLERARPQ